MANKAKKTKDTKKSKRYDEAEKVKLMTDYQELRDQGKKASVAAKEVGIPYITLRTWQKAKEVKPKGIGRPKAVTAPARGAKAKKVRVSKNVPSDAVVLLLPDGMRVECATADAAAALIKALSD